ncbi:MAG: glycosyltransferase family 39 protein [bacterium]|nr:glycosyltransferase family 39 protein [bacterium]
MTETQGRSRLYIFTILFFLITVAFFVRLYNLGTYYYTQDDAFHVALSQGPSFGGVIENVFQYDTHPPLSYLFTHFFLLFSQNDLWIRFSVLFPGMVFIICAYFLLSFFVNQTTVLLTLLVPVFGYGTVVMSESIRPYSLLLCFLTIALIILYRGYERKNFLWMYGYGFFMLLSLSTHYGASIFIAAVGTAWFFKMLLDKKSAKEIYVWASIHVSLFLFSLYLYFAFVEKQWFGGAWSTVTIQDWLETGFPQHAGWYYWPVNVIDFFSYISVYGNYFLGLALSAVCIAGIFSFLRERKYEIPLAAFIIIVLNIVLTYRDLYPFFSYRHSLFVLPFVLIFIAKGYEYLSKPVLLGFAKLGLWTSDRITKYVCACVAASFFLVPVTSTLFASDMYRHIAIDEFNITREQYTVMGDLLVSSTTPDDLIVIDTQYNNFFQAKNLNGPTSFFSNELDTISFGGRTLYYVKSPKLLIISLNDLSRLMRLIVQKRTIPPKVFFASLGLNQWTGSYGSLIQYIAMRYSGYLPDRPILENKDTRSVDTLVQLMHDKGAIQDFYFDGNYYGGSAFFSLNREFIEKYMMKD